ncbi:ATP-dependent nuclease [Anabaena catenula]|uniref:AAA family ATPase n=1 Tax=Anabaena catenula FACHB-362 TaxID=2692877 RepID=A0ABR8J7L5_9NOST|nr:AAA family ATPase [Anabaena catenula]MBD2693643.1 AAA family ATPase [Anabaena catenula FACHB-362]
MAYTYSDLDNKNSKWFINDTTRATLLSIKLTTGQIRGLENVTIDFRYPITAIAGRNGSGKTTVLALAACAFHNNEKGFKLPRRQNSYYTFSDFFIQTKEEAALGDIDIYYKILYNRWKLTKNNTETAKAGWQLRCKKSGGKWNNYASRVNRTVIFLGVERMVPQAERSVSKNYRGKFQPITEHGWENHVRDVVGRILGNQYTNFSYRGHTTYRLPLVAKGEQNIYSGFNMGAGEQSLFELFSTLNQCPEGSLILIDEIELGLHEKAQESLIKELKNICEKRKVQIICTTHSSSILESLPPEGRIFIERMGSKTIITSEISSVYATGKLSERPNSELDILVEDQAAKLILETVLNKELRSRTEILPIGSSAAVMKHLAARYKEALHKTSKVVEVVVFLDGDKSSEAEKNNHIRIFLNALEKKTLEEGATIWVKNRLMFIPGKEWPELWITKPTDKTPYYERFLRELEMSNEEVDYLLDVAVMAGKHNELYTAAKHLSLDEKVVGSHLIKSAFQSNPGEAPKIIDFIQGFL